VKELAADLAITIPAVYQWIGGDTHPKIEIALEILRLAKARGMRLSLDRIYGHCEKLRKAEPTRWAVAVDRRLRRAASV
jgi:hypothetical protein